MPFLLIVNIDSTYPERKKEIRSNTREIPTNKTFALGEKNVWRVEIELNASFVIILCNISVSMRDGRGEGREERKKYREWERGEDV